MIKINRVASKRLKAATLVELLLTMIVSGIIFLLVFDGVAIIKKISSSLNKKLMANQTVLNSHRFMEHLVENADSVIARGDKLIFYRGGISRDSVTIEHTFFLLESNGLEDTLFTDYIDYRVVSVTGTGNRVDSLCIQNLINSNDSIWLEYGVPSNRYAYMNNSEEHENIR